MSNLSGFVNLIGAQNKWRPEDRHATRLEKLAYGICQNATSTVFTGKTASDCKVPIPFDPIEIVVEEPEPFANSINKFWPGNR